MTRSLSTPDVRGAAFGHWLKRQRNALGLTREELAVKIGCSSETIYKIEVGARRPSRQIAQIVGDLLHIPSNEREAFTNFARGQGQEPGMGEEEHAGQEQPWQPAQRQSASNLPAQVTSLVGREREVEEIRALLLREDSRLLTLTGSPGIGKTRLALSVAAQMLAPSFVLRPSFAGSGPDSGGDFEDGVYFVPLAPVIDPELVTATIAKTLGIKETSGVPMSDSLSQWLRGKRILLLLDNFEHLLAGGLQVAQLLSNCPWLKVLATSREALRVYGERQYPVPALDLPAQDESSRSAHPQSADGGLDAKRPGSAAQYMESYTAVQLFVERAQAVKPDFTLTEENAQVVADICVRLDGLPLAIELAAARARLVTPQAMLGVLANPLQLLTGGARDLPPRQQTLRGAIDWSYNLLDDEEQRLFRRLGVFRGGCTLVSVEGVCNARGNVTGDVVRALESLVDKNLLALVADSESSGEDRFSMLETIREYSLERLEESGEGEEVRRLHAEFCLALVEAMDVHTAGAKTKRHLERLELEHDNFRAALLWMETEGEAASELRLATALAWFWIMHGYLSEGRKRLAGALTRAEVLGKTELRAKALLMAGRIAAWHGAYEEARAYYAEVLEIYQELPSNAANGAKIASALLGLGIVARFEERYTQAANLCEEALLLNREAANKEGIASALWQLGAISARVGNASQARLLGEESLALYREIKDAWGASGALQLLGYASYIEGNYSAASSWTEEGLAAAYEMGDKFRVMAALGLLSQLDRLQGDYAASRVRCQLSREAALECGDRLYAARMVCNLGYVEHYTGNNDRAIELFMESLPVCREIGDGADIARCLVGLCGAARALGRPRHAASLLGAAQAQLTTTGHFRWPVDLIEYERNTTATRLQLTDAEWAEAWAEGQAMPLEEVVTNALGQDRQAPMFDS